MNAEREIPTMATEVSGSGAPLVLVPGGLTGWLSWMPHAEALADTRQVTRVQLHNVALGLAGEPLPAGYSAAYEIESLRRTLDALGIARADLAGWSYGGAVALSMALHYPARVRTLTLIEPAAYWVLDGRADCFEVLDAERRYARTLAVSHVSEDQLDAFIHWSGVVPDDVDARTLPQWPVWARHRQSLRMGDAPLRHEDRPDLLRAFDRPVLLVKGVESGPVMRAIVDELRAALPQARTLSLAGGHAAHIVSMDAFMARFRKMLEAESAAP